MNAKKTLEGYEVKELQEMINSEMSRYLESGGMEKRIKQKVSETFESCIDDAFRWGDINKNLKAIIDEKLIISLDSIDFQSYNAVMLEALKGKIAKFTNDQALQAFEKEIEKLFSPAPKEISINDVVEKVIKDWRSDDPCDCDMHDKYATVNCDIKSYGIDITIRKDDYSSSDKVDLYIRDGKLRISYKMELNPTSMYGVEGWIFKLYSGGTIITGLDDFDPDDCDLALWEDRD